MNNYNRKIRWAFVVAAMAIFLGFGFVVKSAQAGDPIPGVDGPPPGSAKGKVDTEKNRAFRAGRNPQSGATIKSNNRSVPSGKDGMGLDTSSGYLDAFPTRYKKGGSPVQPQNPNEERTVAPPSASQ